jgi:hypothetical protein
MAKKTYKEPVEEVEALEEQEAPLTKVEDKVEFEEWLALRQAQIPAHHHKEIIIADFKGRGLSMKETVQTFDEALKRYGVKLG